jgi:hypothetical protein
MSASKCNREGSEKKAPPQPVSAFSALAKMLQQQEPASIPGLLGALAHLAQEGHAVAREGLDRLSRELALLDYRPQ